MNKLKEQIMLSLIRLSNLSCNSNMVVFSFIAYQDQEEINDHLSEDITSIRAWWRDNSFLTIQTIYLSHYVFSARG